MVADIHELRRSEIPAFIDLLRHGFGGELEHQGTDLRWIRRMLTVATLARGIPARALRRVTGNEATILMAIHRGHIAGSVTILGRRNPRLTGIVVHPEARGQGVGLQLLQEGLRRLQARGHRWVSGAAIDPRALALAQKAGFRALDQIDLYRLPLPAAVARPPGTAVRRARRTDLCRIGRRQRPVECDLNAHPFALPLLGSLCGLRVRHITAWNNDAPIACCSVSSARGNAVGEMRTVRARADHPDGVLACLALACRWLESLGKIALHLYLSADSPEFGEAAAAIGATKCHTWTRVAVDLDSWSPANAAGRGGGPPPRLEEA